MFLRKKYIEYLLKLYGMKSCKAIATLLSPSTKLQLYEGAK